MTVRRVGEYVCLRIRHIERADEWHHVVWDGPVGFVVVLGDIGPDMDGLFLQVYVFTFQKGYFASLPRFYVWPYLNRCDIVCYVIFC